MPDRIELSHHKLPTSAQLIGVCMTVISLVKLLHLKSGTVVLDSTLVMDTVFLPGKRKSFLRGNEKIPVP